MENKQVGYLIPSDKDKGFVVECEDCCKDKRVRIYEVNIRPYKQSCNVCKKVLIESTLCELYDGKGLLDYEDY